MIRVTVELVPFGVGEPQVLGTAVIANDGTGSPKRGNYYARFAGKRGRFLRRVEVKDFPRQRLLAWDLLYRVLREAYGDRNP